MRPVPAYGAVDGRFGKVCDRLLNEDEAPKLTRIKFVHVSAAPSAPSSPARLRKPLFSLMWSSPDVVGLLSNNVVSFSRNVVLSDPLFSLNSVSKPRMLSVRADYVLSSSLGLECAVRRRRCHAVRPRKRTNLWGIC